MAAEFQSLSAREIVAFYYRHRKPLLLAFGVPFLLAVLISFVPTPRYTASSVLTVRLGSEFVYQPESGSTQNSAATTIPFNPDQIFKAEVAILSSNDLHAEVIRKIGLYPDLTSGGPASFAEAVSKFNKRLEVNLEKESSVITVGFEDKDSETAVKALGALLDLYMEKRKALFLEPRMESAKAHADEAHQRAVEAGKALEDYKQQNSIHSLKLERTALIDQRDEVEKMRVNYIVPELDSKLAEIDARLDQLNKVESQLNVLTHDANIAADEYGVFAHRLSEAIAYEDLERERAGAVRIIQPPAAQPYPRSLQLPIILGGLVLSLIFTLLAAVLIDSLSSGFATPEQAEQTLGLPVLAALSRRG